jgi:UDP-glucose 4-epimerase
MTRSLVTGGSGFIGSHVVDALHSAGHEVVVLDRVPPRHRLDVEFRAADITDLKAVCEAMQDIDYVHHVAAVANVNHAFDRPIDCVEVNVLGTAHVLEAARRANAKRVLLASSVWVYNGTPDALVSEDTPLHMPGPGHVYTSSKIASELVLNDYAALYKVPVTVLRYGVPYGPRMRSELLIPAFLKRALSGQPLQIAGDGSQARNFVYVEDLARAHVLALRDACINQTFNLDGTRPVSVLQVAEAVRKLVGAHVAIEQTPARPGDYVGKIVSQEKSKRIMDWEATTPFEEGMRRTYDWYRQAHPVNGQSSQPLAATS